MEWSPIFCKEVLEPFVGRMVAYIAYVTPPSYDNVVEYEEKYLKAIPETSQGAFLILEDAPVEPTEETPQPVWDTILIPVALITEIRFYQEGI